MEDFVLEFMNLTERNFPEPWRSSPAHRGDDEEVLSDINVTPLVDVMLVLLIIFMITAPMLHQGIEVALPTSEAPAIPTRA